MREKKDIRPMLLKFRVALAFSLGGILYSIFKTKRINPPRSLSPESQQFPEHRSQVDSGVPRTELKQDDDHVLHRACSSNLFLNELGKDGQELLLFNLKQIRAMCHFTQQELTPRLVFTRENYERWPSHTRVWGLFASGSSTWQTTTGQENPPFCLKLVHKMNQSRYWSGSLHRIGRPKLALLEFGQQVHANFIKSDLGESMSVNNSLMTLYANCGCLGEANRIFNSMLIRNVISWTALIVGYAKNGKGKESIRLYDEMIQNGIKPDFITFIGLLFACSHAGLVEQGRLYFESMMSVYGITAGPDHYACMIDLLGRSGRIYEAQKLLNEMVVEPDAIVWKALLAACRVHGNIDLAKKATVALFELTPQDAVPYLMLSNIYSSAGKREEAAAVRRLMRSKNVNKEPGFSWLEMNGKVHKFLSEDRSHPKANEIYAKIDDVIVLIKEAGYVPDMNFALHDINEEGKELGLAYHSEKLAVAFGLLYLPQGVPIRIYKNLRVCGDCHFAMKLISKIFNRHIILRDSNYFHHFLDGACSCGDYY